MQYFLLDSWDLSQREVSPTGYSKVSRKGSVELTPQMKCPRCDREIWPRTVNAPFKCEFSGARVADISFGLLATLVVSVRLKEKWTSEGLIGLSFSEAPVVPKFLRNANILPPSRTFYAAYALPTIVKFSQNANATYARSDRCGLCGAGEVLSLARPLFEECGVRLADFFMPSCLPGWFVISQRTVEFSKIHNLANFQIIEGFSWEQGILNRHEHLS